MLGGPTNDKKLMTSILNWAKGRKELEETFFYSVLDLVGETR